MPRMRLPLDALVFSTGEVAVNMVVVGTSPDQLRRWSRRLRVGPHADAETSSRSAVGSAAFTTVLIACGQFRDGLDLVPRGHPGDGRAEVHVYRPLGGQLPKMRRRLQSGTRCLKLGLSAGM